MTSQGKIVHVTQGRMMMIVEHQHGYCLIEMTGGAGKLSIGDTLLGQWDEAGGEVVLRGNEIFDCRFQGTWVSFEDALASARRATGER